MTVSVGNQPGGTHSALHGNEVAFGPLDDWGHSRDIVKLCFLLVLEPSAINASF